MYIIIYNDNQAGLLPVKFDNKIEMEDFVNNLLNNNMEPNEIIVLTGKDIKVFDVAETKTFKLNPVPDKDMTRDIPEDDIDDEEMETIIKTTVPLKKRK